ncbi:hypothetical protein PC129_g11539 [Phytophthora cactorum]|uniref:Phosphodiesterase n=1 Tax=Phytophthora cactorum TaxID=29920 RepID=A0A8T1C0I1_9STRA|nr:hypothetical protein PC115_g12679 [Phytophthora cactorum]KAG3202416.1 hypothetical protein PC128_g3196 [Phytophthora cactorum]KAG3217636.1 hypothetical protein PC129_g11539 [Phytophthora cactorum]
MPSRNPRISNASAQHLRMELDVVAQVETRVQHQRWWSLRFEHPVMEERFQIYYEESSIVSSKWACGVTLGSAAALQAAVFYDVFALKSHERTPWVFVDIAVAGNAFLLVLWGIFLWTARRAKRLGAYFQIMIFVLGLSMLMLVLVLGLPLSAYETKAVTISDQHDLRILAALDEARKAHDVTRTMFFLLVLLGAIATTCVADFAQEIENRYQPKNPYHNALHAASVVWDVNFFLRKLEASRLAPVQLFSALVAAAVHDVNHPGVNNAFLVATTAPLAIKYSDDSVLERMHLAEAFQTCTKDGCDIFEAFPPDLRRQSRLQIISMVLATDLSGHLTHVNRLKSKLYAVHPTSELNDPSSTPGPMLPDELVLQTLIMMADVGHAMKSFPLHLAWSERVAEEFYRQGDTERQFGLTISPLCDHAAGVERFEKNQIGFLDFVVLPLYNAARDVLPLADFDDVITNVRQNAATWENRAQAKNDMIPNSPVDAMLAIPATIEEAVAYTEIVVDVGNDSKTKQVGSKASGL